MKILDPFKIELNPSDNTSTWIWSYSWLITAELHCNEVLCLRRQLRL